MSNERFSERAAWYIRNVVEIDVRECEDAINSNVMIRIEQAGQKMADDCERARTEIEDIDVTIDIQDVKTLFIRILLDFRDAGIDCQNHDVDSAINHMNSGKDGLNSLRQALGLPAQ